ncbi:hypothetical protein EJB05_11662, partial [Eragrostis curvula]
MAMCTAAGWRDWTNLSDGPARLIADRLLAHDVADYVRFRAVCAPWRACSDDPRWQSVFDRRYHPQRWVIIRPPHAFDDRQGHLLNLSTGECVNLLLPDYHHYFVLGPTAEGLLLLYRKDTLIMQILNPLTGQTTDLPHLDTLINQGAIRYQSITLRLNELHLLSAGLSDDSTVVTIFGETYMTPDDSNYLAVARPGGKKWIRIDTSDIIASALPFAGRVYCATARKIMVVETAADKQPQLVTVATCELFEEGVTSRLRRLCLVENDGVLVLVAQHIEYVNNKRQRRCKVYRVDLDAGQTVPVRQVVERAIFIGFYSHRALSVRVGLSPSISANTIYFCKDQVDYDIYRIVDGSVVEDCRMKPADNGKIVLNPGLGSRKKLMPQCP